MQMLAEREAGPVPLVPESESESESVPESESESESVQASHDAHGRRVAVPKDFPPGSAERKRPSPRGHSPKPGILAVASGQGRT